MKFVLLLFNLLLFNAAFGCAVDVAIAEGSAIEGCQGSSLTLSATAGFLSYTWTGPQTGTSSTITVNQSGQYTITAVDGVGCVSTATIDVLFNPVTTPVISSTEGNMICSGQSTVLNVSGTFTSFTWSTGATSASIVAAQAGTYSVLTVDENGCSRNASIFISTPNFEISATPSTICSGNSSFILATGAATYLWSTSEVTSSIGVTPSATTTYTVDMTMGPCSTTLSQTITVIEVETTAIQTHYLVQGGVNQVLDGPTGYLNYDWIPSTFLNSNFLEDPTFNGTTSTSYTLTSTHAGGCTRIDEVTVEVINLSIPTGFSPNGDGFNDFFVIPELDSTYNAEIIIFNRWGNAVFESSAYANNWNGHCQEPLCLGKQVLPDGTYFYEIRMEDLIFKGFTTIKR
ncbi:MAG: gliding motility-associated C-terminal domain-containing protein [Bacteroidota bacterium]